MSNIRVIATRVLLAIIAFVVLIVILYYSTVPSGKDIRKMHEQERIAEYTVQNFSNVKKIEFKSFEHRSGPGPSGWFIGAVVNDDFGAYYHLKDIEGKAEISGDINVVTREDMREEIKAGIRTMNVERRKQPDTNANINDIEIKYFEV